MIEEILRLFRRMLTFGLDIWVQDQTTPPFLRYFMTEDKTDITLTSVVSKDDTVISVSSGHGFTAGGEYILIMYGDYAQQSKVLNVSDNDITIESPIGINLPIENVQIIRGSIEMNVDGSSTPVTFYCRIGNNARPIHIQHMHVFMTDATEGTDVLYGGATALTNGLFVRKENEIGINLGVYKSNQDFLQFGSGNGHNYIERVLGTDFGMNFPFELKKNYGVVLQLSNSQEYIKAVVRDNLTVLTSHRIVATGHTTT